MCVGLRNEAHCERSQANKTMAMSLKSFINSTVRVILTVAVSNKTECFSYKGGCRLWISKHLKEELAWALNTQLLLIMKCYLTVIP